MSVLFGKFFLTPIGKKLPPWLWEIIAVVLLLGSIWLGAHVWLVRHDNGVRAEQKASDQKVFDAQLSGLTKKAGDLANKANTLNRQIAANIRSKTDEGIDANGRTAGAMLLHGPGRAAACSFGARPAATTSGLVPATPQTGVALDSVPYQEWVDLIAMPFAGTIIGGREHDDLLVEVKGWHTWYATFTAQWQAWQKQAQEVRQKP